MANLVTFAKKLWKDATSGGTPITAAELNRMEDGINNCANQINRLGDSVSQRAIVVWGKSVSVKLSDGSICLVMVDASEVDTPTIAIARAITNKDTIRFKLSYIVKGTQEIKLSNNLYDVTLCFTNPSINGSWKLIY